MSTEPTFADILAAVDRISPFVHRTPVLSSRTIDEIVGAPVHLKFEHLQRTGSFKYRGATNAVQLLDDGVAGRGVATHSSGNHAAALALAARTRGIPCTVVMPADAPRAKQDATRGYGAEIVVCEPTLEARARALQAVVDKTGAHEIHPFDDPAVIAGQGTAALELLREVPSIRTVVAPVSGGGLLSGTALAAHGVDRSIAVVGSEPKTVDDAHRSLTGGHLVTGGNGRSIADGLLAVLSERTFRILRDEEVDVVTVSDDAILDAMALLLTRTKQLVEPSGATAVAGLLRLADEDRLPEGPIGAILSGGNVDLSSLPFGNR